MNIARIAELLEPFLHAPVSAVNDVSFSHSTPPAISEGHDSHPLKDKPDFLSPAQLQHISTYIDLLIRWNRRINLTSIRNPEEIVTRHFGESLFAARHLLPRDACGEASALARADRDQIVPPAHRSPAALSAADVGSGAGFPGIPIKLWAPHVSLTLIESNQKKTAFLREVARALILMDVNIQNTRAELQAAATFHLVTLRAVERFESILPVAASLVAQSGRLALLIGAAQESRARATLPQLTWSTPIPVPQSHSRILLMARN